MSELRLVPAALAVWAATLAGIVWGTWASLVAVAVVVAVSVVCAVLIVPRAEGPAPGRGAGQAMLVGGLGCAASAVTAVRMATAKAWEFGSEVTGTVSGQPTPTIGAGGGFLLRLSVPGHPGSIPVFVRSVPDGVEAGAAVRVAGAVAESTRPGTAQVVINGEVTAIGPPTGVAAWSNHVKDVFAESVARTVGERSQGLIPGMVLGDTSLQTPAEQQAYIHTGLSHLSAVSGANVAIVTTTAAVLASAVGLGLRGRVACAVVALTVFASLVGPEPSVLRASVTGLVGLTAVLASSVAEPVHALSLAVIGLVLVDSNLAVSYGFALSVAATAGIVALSPLLFRALAPMGWPDIVVRALSVAIAADVVTMPLVAAMAGEVSVVSVAANLLVAPVTAPVTVLGLVAVVLALGPGGLETPLLWVIEPLTAWIHLVAQVGAALPGATAHASPLTVVVCYGWVLAGFVLGRPRATVAAVSAVAVVGVVVGASAPWVRPVDVTGLHAHVVTRERDIDPVPANAQVVVVLEEGRPHARPVETADGLPVLYPNRDGDVRLYPDGTQRAASGAF